MAAPTPQHGVAGWTAVLTAAAALTSTSCVSAFVPLPRCFTLASPCTVDRASRARFLSSDALCMSDRTQNRPRSRTVAEGEYSNPRASQGGGRDDDVFILETPMELVRIRSYGGGGGYSAGGRGGGGYLRTDQRGDPGGGRGAGMDGHRGRGRDVGGRGAYVDNVDVGGGGGGGARREWGDAEGKGSPRQGAAIADPIAGGRGLRSPGRFGGGVGRGGGRGRGAPGPGGQADEDVETIEGAVPAADDGVGGMARAPVGDDDNVEDMDLIDDPVTSGTERRAAFKEDKKKFKAQPGKVMADMPKKETVRRVKKKVQAASLDTKEADLEDEGEDVEDIFATKSPADDVGAGTAKRTLPLSAEMILRPTSDRGGQGPGRGAHSRRKSRGGRGSGRRRQHRPASHYAPPPAPAVVVITQPTMTVEELATMMKLKSSEVIKHLMIDLGIMATITQSIDADTVRKVASNFEIRVSEGPLAVEDTDEEGEGDSAAAIGDMGEALDFDPEESLLPRPPVVTIMGHVDHGKTSLLDAIRETKVVAREAGGITQHVSAYQVKTEAGQNVTFVDTPGHAAFSDMRARGANATDIVVLVVAADDGIMEQTKECIATAKMADVPVVVAINKMDKPTADPQRVQSDLTMYDIVPEEFGGETQVALVSAKQKTGLDGLLEKILLQAEVLELKANPNRAAQGVVIEAQMEKGLGMVGTVLIQRGTLRVGDIFVAGEAWGKVRTIIDHAGRRIREAGPSTPVQVGGFDGVPDAGDTFTVVDREDMARDLAEARRKLAREASAATLQGGLMNNIQAMLNGDAGDGKELFELPVLIKADVQGSEQALVTALREMGSEDEFFKARCKLLQSGVGEITKSDIAIATVSNALVIGFNVAADYEAVKDARAGGIDVGYYDVVYNVMDDIQRRLDELVSPTPEGNYVGRAIVKMVFNIGKVGNIAGSYVEDGLMAKGSNVIVKRFGRVVHEGRLKTLKNVKTDVQEMVTATECGIQVDGFEDFEEGDVIECYSMD